MRWHFIGGLQRNKVRARSPRSCTSGSRSTGCRWRRRSPATRRAPPVLVQVNVSGQEQQGGCPPERVAAVVDGCRDLGLDVRGLMAIGPQGADAEVRAAFRARARRWPTSSGCPSGRWG